MRVIQGLSHNPSLSDPVLTIGNFDGQHRGHLALLTAVVEVAKQQGGTPTVLTFFPHPFQYFKPEIPFQFLTTQEQKLTWFEENGIEAVVMLEFNRELAELTPDQFIFDILRDKLNIRTLLVGHHFVFGKDRTGSTQDLIRQGPKANFQVQTVSPFPIGGEVVSSTRIRRLIKEGKVWDAFHCLGRPYSVGGQVITGEQRGEQLGYRTANFPPPSERVIPADGVYVTTVVVGKKLYDAVTYVGTRPTFGQGERLIEVHVLDASPTLYGNHICVNFLDWIRGDQSFASPEALSERICQDIQLARQKLHSFPHRGHHNYSQISSNVRMGP
jgi:riboflavin kinase/FMN adenylyltransferase